MDGQKKLIFLFGTITAISFKNRTYIIKKCLPLQIFIGIAGFGTLPVFLSFCNHIIFFYKAVAFLLRLPPLVYYGTNLKIK